MKCAAMFLVGSMFLIASCGKEEPVSYLVPKQAAPEASAQKMGSDADNQAVLAAHAAQTALAPAGTGFTAELPKGWTEKAGSGMRKVSYSIEGTSIDFYLISLTMGDVPSNVNRWRGQVGLPPVAPEEIAKEVQTFKAGGHDVNYIEIYNAEGGKGIIAAIVGLSPNFWYFTAKGSVTELQANAADLRTFLESLQFGGHNH
ncbi:hypothetical protein [Pontiella sulfatireligans]|uniref:PsbP C-terminal domain-containing protein n=1 Tax=Pontiella sulfatireligans TaxID=2750658 RepID=A0A6C2UQE0_9BACT|nr:hypothetical protein [Pontiella sulfatireligans]VGO22505.1 hypothetical protein SCARR_04588 [Pontiella sulfatireligans]